MLSYALQSYSTKKAPKIEHRALIIIMSLSHRTDQILTPFIFFCIQSDWNIIKMIEIESLFFFNSILYKIA